MKKKNKGFTMVELLAVITIMGLLAMVAIPAVTKYLIKSRTTSLDTMVKSTYEAAENYMMNNNIIVRSGDPAYVISADTLVQEQYLEELIDPAGNNKRCDTNANSKVEVTYDTASAGIINYKFKVTIVCPSKTLTKTFPE